MVRVVDGVMEGIRLGLELGLPRHNQWRVSGIKFLGELYNYQLVESNVIFRTLYQIMSFGVNPSGESRRADFSVEQEVGRGVRRTTWLVCHLPQVCCRHLECSGSCTAVPLS